jgi:hypothetical protein
MTAVPLLWPIVVGLIVILSAPTLLLFATAPLERLLALPEPDRRLLAEQRAILRINQQER